MSRKPVAPLRWYEHLALILLAQSPRIHSIQVTQEVAPDDDSLDDPEDDDIVDELERLYRLPNGDRNKK